jgi:hypothetical protein
MAILNYSDLGLNKSKEIRIFKWGDKDIEVVKYLPIDSKYDIIMITLQEAYEEGIYNPIKLDIFYHLNLVYMYTNIVFSDEDRADELALYDALLSSGFLEEFLKHISIRDYAEMQDEIEKIAEMKMKYNVSAASVMKKFVDDLPVNAEAAQQIMDSFDKDKYQAVVDFAQAANGGRPVK